MLNLTPTRTIAGLTAAAALALGAWAPATFAKNGADDAPGHVRHTGADDGPNHDRVDDHGARKARVRAASDSHRGRRGRGRGRGTDDAPGHVRHSGLDDGPNHR